MKTDSKTPATQDAPSRFVGRTKGAIVTGLLSCFVLIGGIGTWATTAKLSSAVVTNGQVVVSSEAKRVQHPDGGIVGSIQVANGDRVAAGDVVMTLDASLLTKSRAVLDGQLVALEAQHARLLAERDGLADIVPGAYLADRLDDFTVRHAIELEEKVLDAKAAARDSKVKTFEHQIDQFRDQIQGLETQRKSTAASIEMVVAELADLEPIYQKGYVTKPRITGLKRERSDLEGTLGALKSQIAMAKGQIAETEQHIEQVAKDFHQETISRIESITPEIAKLREQLESADLQLSRVAIRATSDGIVNQLAVHTVGGVIQPGETVMKIVPTADSLVIQAKVLPKDINNVAVGQEAKLVISAFDHNSTPDIHGKVTYISADLTSDERQEVSYYDVRIALDDPAESGLALAFLPGMQAEVFISAGEKTLLQYLLEPMKKRLSHTFREI